jgi:hypothetical protein
MSKIGRVTRISRHHDYIVTQRKNGATVNSIADAIGVNRMSLSNYCSQHGIGKFGIDMQLPHGTIDVLRAFDVAQLKHLEKRALEIGCETLAEYVIEIVRDALAVDMEQEE